MGSNQSSHNKFPVVLFFVLALLIGGGIAIPLLIWPSLPGILGQLAASSATIAALIVVGLTEGTEGLKKLLSGFKKWRINPLWYIIVIFSPAVILLIALGIYVLLGNSFPIMQSWVALIPMFIFLTIFAGIGEEIGWRGYATPKLHETRSALQASLIVGVVWAAWHLPLFWFEGWEQYELRMALGLPAAVIGYSIYVIALAVIYAWSYFATDGNLWMPVLFHGALNTTGWFFSVEKIVMPLLLFAILTVIYAVVVVVFFGSQRLSRSLEG